MAIPTTMPVLATALAMFLMSANSRAQIFTQITNSLPSSGPSTAIWGDYDNDKDLDVLVIGEDEIEDPSSRLYRNEGNGVFVYVDAGFFPVLGNNAAWGDYDNDGDLDLLLSGHNFTTASTRLYRNEGNGLFTDVQITLFRDFVASVSWGDYDRDGDLDIVMMTGAPNFQEVPKVFRNDGNGQFSQVNIELPVFSSAEWFDCDGDGLLDILFTGGGALLAGGGEGASTRIFRNWQDAVFVDALAAFPGVTSGVALPRDCDNDGDADVLLLGATKNGTPSTDIYRNEGANGFTNLNAGLAGIVEGSAAWGDVDNDGYVDILLTGDASAGQYTNLITRIYRNTGEGGFANLPISLPGTLNASATWADVDNDGDLDFALLGTFAPPLNRNDFAVSNGPPSTPTGLNAAVAGNAVEFRWNASIDSNQTNGLTYNVRVATTPGGLNVLSPMSDLATGVRLLPKAGNAGTRLNLELTNLPVGTYYWSVQAVDSAYLGSLFATEAIFQVLPGPPLVGYSELAPSASSNVVLASSVNPRGGETLAYFEHGPSTNYGRIGDAKNIESGATDVLLTESVTNLGLGETIHFRLVASNSFGLTSGRNQVVQTRYFTGSLTGLTGPDCEEAFLAWGDYDNDGDLDLFLSSEGGLARNDNGTLISAAVSIPGSTGSFAAWGVYDNDGDLDLLVASSGKLYRNNADGTFTDSGANLPSFSMATAAWGDYDNDGDQDILIAGLSAAPETPVTAVYRNMGAGQFEDSGIPLPGISVPVFAGRGSVAWGDFDRDGDLDLLLAGGGFTRVYANNQGVFADAEAGLADLETGVASAADYDNDGDLDVVAAGLHEGFSVTRIYRNGGNGAFVDIHAPVIGAHSPTVAWGDYDNDGDLDLIISSQDCEQAVRLYRNDESDSFVMALKENPAPSIAKWADFDDDGDLDLVVNPAMIYNNQSLSRNDPPTAPGGLATAVGPTAVSLQWTPATDPNQPSGLTYNLRVGTAPGKADIVSPASDLITGTRRSPAPGNAGPSLNWSINSLRPGTYYWSVQAVDNSFAGGPFATEASFIVPEAGPALRISSLELVSGSSLRLTVTGQTNQQYVLEGSSNLTDWSPVQTNAAPDGSVIFSDSFDVAAFRRFYRVRLME